MPSLTTTITKARISSPLEAGPSLLDAKQLPPQLTAALDYVSSRLTRRRLHLSLIVVRKDVQIPQSPATSPQASPKRPDSPGHSITTSPAKSLFGGSAFTRTPSKSSLSSMSDSGSSTSGSSSSSSSLSRTNWPGLPSSPADRSASHRSLCVARWRGLQPLGGSKLKDLDELEAWPKGQDRFSSPVFGPWRPRQQQTELQR